MNYWEQKDKEKKEAAAKQMLWLRSLQPGHKVAVRRERSNDYDIYEVDRITPTQVVVKFNGRIDYRYNKKTGARIGCRGSWSFPSGIEPVTNEIVASIELRNMRYWFSTLADNHKSLDLQTLRALKAAISPILAAKP